MNKYFIFASLICSLATAGVFSGCYKRVTTKDTSASEGELRLSSATTQASFARRPDQRNLATKIKDYTNNFHVVETAKLYRSAQLTPSQFRHYIKRYGIKTVVNLRGKKADKIWWQREEKAVTEAGAVLENLRLNATRAPMREEMVALLEILDRAAQRGPVLIHCRRGADRTGLAVALYAIEYMGQKNADATKHLTWKYGHYSANSKLRKFVTSWQNRTWLASVYTPQLLA